MHGHLQNLSVALGPAPCTTSRRRLCRPLSFLRRIPESIELFVKGQAFSRTYDLAPRPTLPPSSPSPVSKLDRRHTGKLRKRDSLLTEGGKGVGEEPNHTNARKPGPLEIIPYSLQAVAVQ
jgi:hypothetical protein